jgi:putative dehydrogenase
MTLTIAIIAAGAMGSAVAARLTRHGVTVLTSLDGRSPPSRARAEAAGMQHAGDAEIVARADLILSIVPPADALALAERFAATMTGQARVPAFVDCNAIGVTTMAEIGRVIAAAGGRVIDGAIIGFPPKGEEAGPTFYFSGPDAGEASRLGEHGLVVKTVDGPVGAASALKLSYAGITKGLVAIASAMIMASERAGAGAALKAELAASQPQLLARFEKTLPDMYPKAYRWVEEMHAIADFIDPAFPESKIFEGAAGLYERVAGSEGDRAQMDAFFKRG